MAALLAFAGCLEAGRRGSSSFELSPIAHDELDVVLPNSAFYLGKTRDYRYLPAEPGAPFHSLEEVYEHVMGFQERRPDLDHVDPVPQFLNLSGYSQKGG